MASRIPMLIAEKAARQAGAELLSRFRRPLNIKYKKSTEDLVTDADQAAEQAALLVIQEYFPDDPVLAEESNNGLEVAPGFAGEFAERTWLVDPLDGTVYYARGLDSWAVSIAALGPEDDLGVVYDPGAGELWSTNGQDIFLNNRPLVYKQEAEQLDRAHLAFNCSALRDGDNQKASQLLDIFRHTERFRDFGSPAKTLAWLASGRIDLVYYDNPRLLPWDTAAGLALCRTQGLTIEILPAEQSGGPERLLAGPDSLVQEFIGLLS